MNLTQLLVRKLAQGRFYAAVQGAVCVLFAQAAIAQNSGNPYVDCGVPQVHASVTHTPVPQTTPVLYQTHIDAHWTILPPAAEYCVQVKSAPFGTNATPVIVLDTTVTDTLISFTRYHLNEVALNVRVTPCVGGQLNRMLTTASRSGYVSVATPNGGLVIIDVVGKTSGSAPCIGSCTLGAAATLGSCAVISDIAGKAAATNPEAYELRFYVYNTAGSVVCTRTYKSGATTCYAQLAADTAGSCFSSFSSPVCFTSSTYTVRY